MNYKESCKVEGEVITRIKILRMYFNKVSCKQICEKWKFNKNTLTSIIKKCALADKEVLSYLKSNSHISSSKLFLFDFLKHNSRKPLFKKMS